MRNNDPNQLDSIINGALSGYTAAEPLAGIEQRVLHRVRSANAGHQASKLLGWAVACPIVIALLPIAIAVWTPPARTLSASLPRVGPPANALTIPRTVAPEPRRRLRSTPVHPSISREERTLLAMVRSHPAESQQFFAEISRRGEEPVEVHEIEIAPLQIPEVQ